MVTIYDRAGARPIHPLHAIFLSFPFPLFLGAVLSDLAYGASYEVQWANFAQWLNAGGMAAGALVGPWALVNLFRPATRGRHSILYFLFLLATGAAGLTAALVHARDAYGVMPLGLWLSGLTAVLALIASWIGFSGQHFERLY